VLIRSLVGSLLLVSVDARAEPLDDAFQLAGEQTRAAAASQQADELARARARHAAGQDTDVPPEYQTPLALSTAAVAAVGGCFQAGLASDPDFEYCLDEPVSHSFTLIDAQSPRINPAGHGAHRDFTFSAPRRARQETDLLVYEWGSDNPHPEQDKDSAWSMMTEIVFLPRQATPSARLVQNGEDYEVTLPTGETVLFDAKTKEIVSGPLVETAPIDMNQDRNARRFAGLRYDGRGIMIRSDQRGDSPRSAVVWGIKKTATAVWRGKTCLLSPADVWEQDADGAGLCLYPDDAAFFAMLKRRCGWKLDPAALNAP
jgi:hypothetical protein